MYAKLFYIIDIQNNVTSFFNEKILWYVQITIWTQFNKVTW